MQVHNISIHSLRLAYGKSARDDKMIDAYLTHSRELMEKKRNTTKA